MHERVIFSQQRDRCSKGTDEIVLFSYGYHLAKQKES